MELYREFSIPWPPALDCGIDENINFGSLTLRASEVAFFFHKVFGLHARTEDELEEGRMLCEFVDVNPSVKRLAQRDTNNKLKSPWRPYPPCLSGQSKIVMRWKEGKVTRLRPLAPVEYFSLIGWPPQAFAEGTCLATESLGANLCGNAFSAFHLGPVIVALLACAGRAPRAEPRSDTKPTERDSDCVSVCSDSVDSLGSMSTLSR